MPLVAALAIGVALVFGVLSLMLPWVLKIITLPVTLAGVLAAGFAFWLGDELQWFSVMRLGRAFENNRVTSEVEDTE